MHTLRGQLIYLSGRSKVALVHSRTNERTDGRTDGRESFQKWSWFGRLRYDRIRVRECTYRTAGPYAEKNAITPRRIWRQCTGACHRESTPLSSTASSLPPFPSSLRPSIGRACRMPIVSPPLFLFFSRYQTRLFSPIRAILPVARRLALSSSRISAMILSLSPHTSPFRSLETRLRYLADCRYGIHCPPPSFLFSLSFSRRETPDCDLRVSYQTLLLRLCIIWLLASTVRQRRHDKK